MATDRAGPDPIASRRAFRASGAESGMAGMIDGRHTSLLKFGHVDFQENH